MRLLMINPNTDAAVTARVASVLQPHLPEGTELVTATGRFGFPYIVTRTAYAVGGHAAIEALARHGEARFDAVLLACFGDPALMALKELATVPVIGMAEASCQAAAREEGPFAIVTGGIGWQAMLREFVAGLGLSERLADVRTVTLSGGEIMRAPEQAVDLLAREIEACQRLGAKRVILGGAGLAGLAAPLQVKVSVPVLDCVALLAREALATLAGHPAASGPVAPEAAFMVERGWLAAP